MRSLISSSRVVFNRNATAKEVPVAINIVDPAHMRPILHLLKSGNLAQVRAIPVYSHQAGRRERLSAAELEMLSNK